MAARGVLGIAGGFVAEAEPITVRNRNPRGHSADPDGRTIIHADRNANPRNYSSAHPNALRDTHSDDAADGDGAVRSQ